MAMTSRRTLTPAPTHAAPPHSPRHSEGKRICSRCGGGVEVITIPWSTAAGRQVTARIGACVRCAQWFNEAGLRELEWVEPSSSAEGGHHE